MPDRFYINMELLSKVIASVNDINAIRNMLGDIRNCFIALIVAFYIGVILFIFRIIRNRSSKKSASKELYSRGRNELAPARSYYSGASNARILAKYSQSHGYSSSLESDGTFARYARTPHSDDDLDSDEVYPLPMPQYSQNYD